MRLRVDRSKQFGTGLQRFLQRTTSTGARPDFCLSYSGISHNGSEEPILTPPVTAIDLPTIRRYVKMEMYREAIRDLETAVKSDEFNVELRLLYGTSLRHVRRYDDSVYNLSIAIKLDGMNWAVQDELLKVYLDRYAETPTNSDRIAASKAATQLMSMRGGETDEPALKEAKQQAEEIIARFQDPVGSWRNDQQEIEVIPTPDGKFRVKEHIPGQRCAQTCFSITFEKVAPQTYEGSGLNTDTVCVFDFSYEADVF